MKPLYEGDIDMAFVIKALRNAGYDYDINIEDESLGHFILEERQHVLKRDVEFLRKML